MNPRLAQSKVLTTPFDRRRIVFWYDANQEAIEAFESLRLPDAEIPNIAFRTKLTAHKSHLEVVSISGSASQGEKTKALKETESLRKVIDELDGYERDILYPLATEQLEIDLDDGVKANYPKFGAALKKIVGLDAAED